MADNDYVARDMDIPENCELRDDFMSCTRDVFSSTEKNFTTCAFISAILLGLSIICRTILSESEIEIMGVVAFSIFFIVVFILPTLCLRLYGHSVKEYIQLNENGFHHEFRSIFGRGRVKDISLSSILEIYKTEYHSGWLLLLYSKAQINNYCIEISTTGANFRFCKMIEPDSLQSWIVTSANYVLQNLLLNKKITDSSDNSMPVDILIENASKSPFGKFVYANNCISLLPSEIDVADTFPLLDKPGYSIWNMEKNYDNMVFSRYNQYSRNWFNALHYWRNCVFILLILYSFAIPSLIYVIDISKLIFLCMIFICNAILGGIFLLPVSFLFSFIFTRFTTVSWTFSAGKAKLKRTLFGIPFLFRAFDYSELQFVEIRQRFFLGTTDGNCDIVFKNGNKKELFRMKNVERCDAYWMISQLTQNRFLR